MKTNSRNILPFLFLCVLPFNAKAVLQDAGFMMVEDTATNLTWEKGFSNNLSWHSSFANCAGLGLGGFTDWRMPTKTELLGLVGQNLSLMNSTDRSHWSLETRIDKFSGEVADHVKLSTGSIGFNPLSTTNSELGVRCVRDGLSGPTNSPPGKPTIFSASPNIVQIGQTVSVSAAAGSDPDGDEVRLRCSAAHSNYSDTSPYYSAYSTGTPTQNISFTFTFDTVVSVDCVTQDRLGLVSPLASTSVTVTPTPPDPLSLTIPNFTWPEFTPFDREYVVSGGKTPYQLVTISGSFPNGDKPFFIPPTSSGGKGHLVCNTTETCLTPLLNQNTDYTFTLVLADNAGQSITRTFVITVSDQPKSDAPPPPVLSAPNVNQSSGLASFNWTGVTGLPNWYEITINGGASPIVLRPSPQTGLSLIASESNGLQRNVNYTAYVRAHNTKGYSAPSNSVSFLLNTVQPQPPVSQCNSCPTTAIVGQLIEYRIQVTDSNNLPVSLHANWGDGQSETINSVPSGLVIVLTHTYSQAGTFQQSFKGQGSSGAIETTGTTNTIVVSEVSVPKPDLGIAISSDRDVIDAGKETKFYTIITNNSDVDVTNAPVSISYGTTDAGGASISGGNVLAVQSNLASSEWSWSCGSLGVGIGSISPACRTGSVGIGDSSFSIDVPARGSVVVLGLGTFPATTDAAKVEARVVLVGDSDPKNNEVIKELNGIPRLSDSLLSQNELIRHSPSAGIGTGKLVIVFTHGWQSRGCKPESLWSGNQASQASELVLSYRDTNLTPRHFPDSDRPRVYQYFWQGACTRVGLPTLAGYIEARQQVFAAGAALKSELIEELGSNFSGKIHFIGHSLGTAVTAIAVREFLKKAVSVKEIQVTLLDAPTRIAGKLPELPSQPRKSPIFRETANKWRFDENYFAKILPLGHPLWKDKLRVENYYARGSFDTSFGESWGLGTKLNGESIHNYELSDPHQIGVHLIDELFINNDHSGVQQWYRWSIWPSQSNLGDSTNFVCDEDHNWSGKPKFDLKTPDESFSLNPCRQGFNYSILLANPTSFPAGNGGPVGQKSIAASYDFLVESIQNGCYINTKGPGFVVVCKPVPSNNLSITQQIVSEETATVTANTWFKGNLQLSRATNELYFDYKLSNVSDTDYVQLILDGSIVWSMSASSVKAGEWQNSGMIPVSVSAGEKLFMVVVYGTSGSQAQFEMRNLELKGDAGHIGAVNSIINNFLLSPDDEEEDCTSFPVDGTSKTNCF